MFHNISTGGTSRDTENSSPMKNAYRRDRPAKCMEKKVIPESMYQETKEMIIEEFGASDIPNWEITEETVESIHGVMCAIRRVSLDKEKMIKEYEAAGGTYAEKTRSLKSKLNKIGFTTSALERPYVTALEDLSHAACVLNLNEPSNTRYLLSLQQLSRDKDDAEDKWSILLKQKAYLTSRLNDLMVKTADLERMYSIAMDKDKTYTAGASKKSSQSDFFCRKMYEYKVNVAALRAKMTAVMEDPSLSHTELLQLNDKNVALAAQLDQIANKLDCYQSLPPNEELAKLKIEEANAELNRLSEELRMGIEGC